MMTKNEQAFIKEMKDVFLKHKALGTLRLAQLMHLAFSQAVEKYHYKRPSTKICQK